MQVVTKPKSYLTARRTARYKAIQAVYKLPTDIQRLIGRLASPWIRSPNPRNRNRPFVYRPRSLASRQRWKRRLALSRRRYLRS